MVVILQSRTATHASNHNGKIGSQGTTKDTISSCSTILDYVSFNMSEPFFENTSL